MHHYSHPAFKWHNGMYVVHGQTVERRFLIYAPYHQLGIHVFVELHIHIVMLPGRVEKERHIKAIDTFRRFGVLLVQCIYYLLGYHVVRYFL